MVIVYYGPVSRSQELPSIYRLTEVLRYLSAALGRPMMINDDDITIPYPEAAVSSSPGIDDPHEAKTVPGIVAHIKSAHPYYYIRLMRLILVSIYRLAQITTQVLRKLYGSKKHDKVARDESTSQIEAQLSKWLDERPRFLNPEEQLGQNESEVFYDVPWIFKRYSKGLWCPGQLLNNSP